MDLIVKASRSWDHLDILTPYWGTVLTFLSESQTDIFAKMVSKWIETVAPDQQQGIIEALLASTHVKQGHKHRTGIKCFIETTTKSITSPAVLNGEKLIFRENLTLPVKPERLFQAWSTLLDALPGTEFETLGYQRCSITI
jgi:hypothetical protein